MSLRIEREDLENIIFGRKDSIWQIGVGAISLVNQAEKVDFNASRLFAMLEHSGAGIVWDHAYKAGLIPADSTLVNIDAHDDLACPENMPDRLEDIFGGRYQVGSFILPRVNVGMIGKIVWVTPQFKPDEWATTTKTVTLKNRNFELEIRKDLPYINCDLLSIDLDFFAPSEHPAPVWYPDFLFARRVRKFLESACERIKGSKITTVAVSPGFIDSSRSKVALESALDQLTRIKSKN